MDHFFECDGVPYRVTLMVPLNQTHRTTEPKFKMKCNEMTTGGIIVLSITGVFVFLVLFFIAFPPILKHFSPFHHKRMCVIVENSVKRLYNIFHRPSPLPILPWPTRDQFTTSFTTLSSSSSRSTRPELPLTTTEPGTDSAPRQGRQGFFSRVMLLFSITKQPERSDATAIHVSNATESRESYMEERGLDVAMAMPSRSRTRAHEPDTDEIPPAYRN